MATTQVETVSSAADKAKIAAVAALVVASIAGFYLLNKQGPVVQWAALIVGLLVSAGVFLISELFIFGGFNSMQFSAMNSVTLKDMEGEFASSGNSLLSMVQMLAMSMGVAIAGALLTGYTDMWHDHEGDRMLAIRATFATVALMTLAATLVFSQLEPDEVVRPAPDAGD